MDLELFVATARGIWFKRNLWVHDERFSLPNDVAHGARRAVEDLHNLYKGREELSHANQEKWQAPSEGWTNLICDVACDKKNGRMGMGILLRDNFGHVKAATLQKKP